MSKWVVALGIFFASAAQSAPKPQTAESFAIQVTHADAVSHFEIAGEGDKRSLQFTDKSGKPFVKPITQADVSYLMGKLTKVKSTPNNYLQCPRSRVDVAYHSSKANKGFSVCLFGKDPASIQIVSLVNLLVTFARF